MEKMNRGVVDTAVREINQNVGVRWNGNNIVTIISKEHGMNPTQKCLRYSSKDKKIEIDHSFLIKANNQYMGKMDQLDNHISNYRITLKGKKWYIPLICWQIDLS